MSWIVVGLLSFFGCVGIAVICKCVIDGAKEDDLYQAHHLDCCTSMLQEIKGDCELDEAFKLTMLENVEDATVRHKTK